MNGPAKPTDMQNNRAKRHYFMAEWASLERAADLWRAVLFTEGVGPRTPRVEIAAPPGLMTGDSRQLETSTSITDVNAQTSVENRTLRSFAV